MKKRTIAFLVLFGLILASQVFLNIRLSAQQTPPVRTIIDPDQRILPPATTTIQITTSTGSAPSRSPQTRTSPRAPLRWGAYVGNAETQLQPFESTVGAPVNIVADFESWDSDFPLKLTATVGKAGKTLLVFWEPNFGYQEILDGHKDASIERFAREAREYGYPVILVPFDEMNLNEEAWGYDHNHNTAETFQKAWMKIHDAFASSANVKFGLAYNAVSVPDVPGNQFTDYYPGSAFVDYVGVDGFNPGNPKKSFQEIFDPAIQAVSIFQKPILIFSMASVAGPDQAAWIREGLGTVAPTYPGLVGWIWFNQAGSPNWSVDSDERSLEAFRSVIPKAQGD